MPELPEVETIVRDLRPQIVGRRIVGVQTDWPKCFTYPKSAAGFRRAVVGRTITGIGRRAKRILIYLDTEWLLVIHQKISGRLLAGHWERVQLAQPGGGRRRVWRPIPPSGGRYVHLLFDLDDGRQLALSDLRKFGTAMVGRAADILNRADMRMLGPEPLDRRFTLDVFRQLCARRRGRIKSLLMNPTFIAGIGNLYSDEILYAARLHPLSRIERLEPPHLDALYRSLRSVLRRAVRLRGTGVDAPPLPLAGAKGYDRVRLVYHRSTCPHGHTLTRIRVGGRSAHFCPIEQKLV
jgi:formamidopyrimidine-DNA glycosylase